MASSQIPNNLIPNDIQLSDLLDLFKRQTLLGLNCHHIATVQSFDSVRQVASATVNYKKTFFVPDPVTGVYGPVLRDYPQLIDCPVVVLGGGLGSLTFPVASGDECVVLFNDRDLDNWFQGGGSGTAAATPRLHSFSDGMILVGVRSLANVLKTYDMTRAVLRLGNAIVGVGGGEGELVKIANESFSLGALMQDLITNLMMLASGSSAQFTNEAAAATALAAASTGPLAPLQTGFTAMSVGFMALATAFTSLGTFLSTFSSEVSELLE